MTPHPLTDLVDPGWARALEPVAGDIAAMGDFLRGEVADGHGYLPSGDRVLRAFTYPFDDVRVLIVGQDPYPTPGHPIGLSFAVDPHVRPVPRSLANIYRELNDDLGVPPVPHGDLTSWAENGVMLLNRVLTVRPGDAGSHRKKGWEAVTDRAIQALVERGGPLVAILWGRDALSLKPRLGDIPTVESAHPSPLSASRGFFGSKPFSRVNELLVAQGAEPVEWRLPVDPVSGSAGAGANALRAPRSGRAGGSASGVAGSADPAGSSSGGPGRAAGPGSGSAGSADPASPSAPRAL